MIYELVIKHDYIERANSMECGEAKQQFYCGFVVSNRNAFLGTTIWLSKY